MKKSLADPILSTLALHSPARPLLPVQNGSLYVLNIPNLQGRLILSRAALSALGPGSAVHRVVMMRMTMVGMRMTVMVMRMVVV